ncbi:2-hydroxycarboxylate transporter family protein [Streptomyces sp. NPDC005009]
MDFDIGIVPLPVFVVLAALVAGLSATRHITGELAVVIGIMAVFAFALAEADKRLPVLGAIGCASILGAAQGELIARVLPAIFVGNLTAILLAGLLGHVCRRRPDLTGNGRLDAGDGPDLLETAETAHGGRTAVPARQVAAVGDTAVTLYIGGTLGTAEIRCTVEHTGETS